MQITDIPGPPRDNWLKSLLTQAESRHLEFKRVSGKMVGKALETICAFANTEGGTLVLGIGDAARAAAVLRGCMACRRTPKPWMNCGARP
jgi:predicted HTH transcriptional regulator